MILYLLLQTPNSDGLNKAVGQITESSVKLAEATANYGALKMVFSVFMIFMIVIVLLFVYQIFVLTKKVDIIHTAATKTQEYFEGVSDRTIGTSQGQVIIRRSFNGLSQSIKYAILRIRLENHIDNKEMVCNKVSGMIKNEFSEINSFFSNFICDEKPLCEILNDEDEDVIKEFMLEQIYIPKENFSISNMDQSTDILINGIKLIYIKNL